MRKEQFSWITFYKAIMSTDCYKDIHSKLVDRIKELSRYDVYLQGIQFSLQYSINLILKGLDCWSDSKEEKLHPFGTLQIAVNGKCRNGQWECYESKTAITEIFKYILKTLLRKFLEQEITIEKVLAIETDYVYMNIDELIVWHGQEVCVWHQEQECGEGWICLPRDPEIIRDQLSITVDYFLSYKEAFRGFPQKGSNASARCFKYSAL